MRHNASWVLSACVHGDSPCFSAFQYGLLDKMLDRSFSNFPSEVPEMGVNRRRRPLGLFPKPAGPITPSLMGHESADVT
jgi:hypothetical protein